MELNAYKKVRLVITVQGGHRINDAFLLREGPEVVAIMIDMASKRGTVGAVGTDENMVPLIALDPEGAIDLICGKEEEMTEITFPDYAGWSVWCAEVSRYTIAVCLIKRDDE